jgi:hypothetical protein
MADMLGMVLSVRNEKWLAIDMRDDDNDQTVEVKNNLVPVDSIYQHGYGL